MRTVLVIDDDRDMRELERTALSHNGYAVVTASNGREGLRQLERGHPCLVLLDLMMPVMDGLAFLDERRRRGVAPDVPVLCVSAAGDELMQAARAKGAADCIPKPVDFDDLCDVVARHCDGCSSR
jgi:CheY-like chemotaxis protein